MGYSEARVDSQFLTRLTLKSIAELERTRAQVASLERGAGMISDLEQRKLNLLARLNVSFPSVPVHHNSGIHMAELKEFLEGVYDADLRRDATLQQLTLEHCIGYAVQLLNRSSDTTLMLKGDNGSEILELVASTLAMLSQRADARPVFHASGAVHALVRLLTPLFPVDVVVDAANAVGSLAVYDPIRPAFRAAGCVGALVRLLRADVDATVSAAAVVALGHHAARDTAVQDNIRHMGGIQYLVDLLASDDANVAEVARLCLLSVRHGNVKNQAEVILLVRACPSAIRKLGPASELLCFADATPTKAPSSVYLNRPLTAASSMSKSVTASTVRALIHDLDMQSLSVRFSPATPQWPYLTASTLLTAQSTGGSFDAGVRRSSFTFGHLPASPLTYSAASLNAASHTASLTLTSRRSFVGSPDSGCSMGSLIDAESEMLRKKHLARFSPEELCLLLEEMGFDRLDLRGFKVQHINGFRLLDLSEDALYVDLVLPPSKVSKVQALQRAASLFDRIAATSRQGQLSEAEMRLYLSSQGASIAEVNKIMRLFKTLIKTDFYGFVSFWDFVTGYDWVVQAFNIYHIPA